MSLALFYVGKKQLQAKKLLIFLVENRNFSKALTHGFSQKLEHITGQRNVFGNILYKKRAF